MASRGLAGNARPYQRVAMGAQRPHRDLHAPAERPVDAGDAEPVDHMLRARKGDDDGGMAITCCTRDVGARTLRGTAAQ